MKVLIVASECSPFIKVGGIADVIGSLPIALNSLGVDARIVIPFYKPLFNEFKNQRLQSKDRSQLFSRENKEITLNKIIDITIQFDNKKNPVSVYETKIPGTKTAVYLIYNHEYLANGGIYFSPQNAKSPKNELNRFAFFSKSIIDIFAYQNEIFQTDIIHCNDWHTGMIPQLIQNMKTYSRQKNIPKTIFTIHNLAYQGLGDTDVADKLGLNIQKDQTLKWDSQDDNIDFILQGIVGADYITTVSPKYAEEIMTPDYGEGLNEILKAREGRLAGILNGISYEVFNPLKDPYISANYTDASFKEGKKANKISLQKELGIEITEDKPLAGIISRLANQKGLDIIALSVNEIMDLGYQLVILGTGDPLLESKLKEYNNEERYKGSYRAEISFSEPLARKIYSGSDMFLIPSRYEPCGLTQMISMKYGSVPVVRATGGLYDTVKNLQTGFTFDTLDKKNMLNALHLAIATYSETAGKWDKIVKNCMTENFSWDESAKQYVLLYQRVLSF